MTGPQQDGGVAEAEELEDGSRARVRPLPIALAALLLYAAAVVWLTWPLARHAATDLPLTGRACRFDSLLIGWALSHESRALVSAPSTLPHGNVYYPSPYGLLYGEAGFGALPYFLPVYLLSGNPTLALNVMYLASVTLTAWALHLVVTWWTGSTLASLLAGWTFLMTRWVLWTWVPCAPNYAVLQYLPFIVFFAPRPLRAWSQALRLGALVALQTLTSVYVAAATFAPLAVLALLRLLRRASRASGAKLVAALILALALVAPIYGAYLLVRIENPELSRQTVWVGVPQFTPLPWGPLGRGKPTAVPLAALLAIVLGALSLVFGAWRELPEARRRAWLHAGLWLVVGLVMSLGPAVKWGERILPSPLGLLATWTPLYEIIRVPYRFGIAALIGFCLLTGLGFHEAVRRISGGRIAHRAAAAVGALVLSVWMYAEHRHAIGPAWIEGLDALPRDYPLQRPIDDAAVLAALTRSTGPVLELPAPLRGERLFSPPQAAAMYRSIAHRRPILNGYSGYWPQGFIDRMRLANRLPNPAALATLVQATGLETILVHTDDLPRKERRRWMALASEPDGRLVLIARGARDELVFEVTPEAAND